MRRTQATYPRKDPAKSTSQRCRGEEQGDAEVLLVPLVPHGQVEDDTGEQTGLGDTEEEARAEVARVVLDDAQQGGDDAPDEGERGEPEARGGALEDDVAGDLEEDVADEVQRQAVEILVSA